MASDLNTGCRSKRVGGSWFSPFGNRTSWTLFYFRDRNPTEVSYVENIKAPPEVLRKIGNAIKKLRIDRALSQAELADAAEISVSYLSQIERGTRSVSAKRLATIADALKITLSQFLAYAKTTEEDLWLDHLSKVALLMEGIAAAEKYLPDFPILETVVQRR